MILRAGGHIGYEAEITLEHGKYFRWRLPAVAVFWRGGAAAIVINNVHWRISLSTCRTKKDSQRFTGNVPGGRH